MPATQENYTPKQVARAIGVSESSLKRWCDRGILASIKTAGGHRRIPLKAVLEYMQSTGRPLVRPDILGLPATSGQSDRVLERGKKQLQQALVAGDALACRQVVFDLFLAGHSVAAIGDVVVSPSFQEIGASWACGDIEVYQERRACEICCRALHELERLIPQGKEAAPLALGGTTESDRYDLATTLVAMVLRQNGWQATSLGAGLPFATMLAAIRQHRPQLFWISVSHIADEERFVSDYNAFYEEAAPLTKIAIGGRSLHPALRERIRYTVFCDRLSHLESFLSAHPSQSPSAEAS
jgi:excisionase family DNA binding protein